MTFKAGEDISLFGSVILAVGRRVQALTTPQLYIQC